MTDPTSGADAIGTAGKARAARRAQADAFARPAAAPQAATATADTTQTIDEDARR